MRCFQLLLIFSLINFSLCKGQQFYEMPLDRQVYSTDTLFKNDKVVINYNNNLDKATFSVEFNTDTEFLPNGNCVYQDSSGRILTGSYKNGQMAGLWTEKDSHGNLIGIVNYDYDLYLISKSKLNYGEFVRDTVDPHSFISSYEPTFLGKKSTVFRQFIKENIFLPPSFRFFYNETEKVFVEFDVYENGKVINPKIVRGGNSDLNNEALRVINSSPNWDNFDNEKLNAVRFTFPVIFEK